jgi:putative IMPACT (imprinted ancient) family translation regulator
MNDDGEPSGTAGKPIYNQLLAHDLTNVLIVVVRYFGGTLLGTGGLIQAYKNAAGDMLSKAPIVVRFIEDHFRLTFPYEKLSAVMKILKEENLAPVEPVYDVQCSMSIAVRKSRKEPFIHKLAAISEVSAETL